LDFEFVTKADIPEDRLLELKKQAVALGQRRFEKRTQTLGRIGRNETCPCGSGKSISAAAKSEYNGSYIRQKNPTGHASQHNMQF